MVSTSWGEGGAGSHTHSFVEEKVHFLLRDGTELMVSSWYYSLSSSKDKLAASAQLNLEKGGRAFLLQEAEDGGLQTPWEQGSEDSLVVTSGPVSEGWVPFKRLPQSDGFPGSRWSPGAWGSRGELWEPSYLHAVQGSELFKGKDFSCTGSFGLFSEEAQETACQNRSLLLKLP